MNLPRASRIAASEARRCDFARIVAYIEATEPDEMARRRMGIGIARRLAAMLPGGAHAATTRPAK